MQRPEPNSVGIKWIKGLRGCDLASHWNLQSRWCDLHATYTAWINNQGGWLTFEAHPTPPRVEDLLESLVKVQV